MKINIFKNINKFSQYFSFGEVNDVKVIRKTAMGQLHKDFCYAFVTISSEQTEEDIINNFKTVSRYLIKRKNFFNKIEEKFIYVDLDI